jgi:hypothetical protein
MIDRTGKHTVIKFMGMGSDATLSPTLNYTFRRRFVLLQNDFAVVVQEIVRLNENPLLFLYR